MRDPEGKMVGYSTYFDGYITIEPPLPHYIASAWSDFKELCHVDQLDVGIGIWMQWELREVLSQQIIVWDEGEKFYEADRWLAYMVEHFLVPHGSVANGTIYAQGEDPDDMWAINVKSNVVKYIPATKVYLEDEATTLYDPEHKSDEW